MDYVGTNKKWFIWTTAAMQAAESDRGVPGLTWCLQWGHPFNAFSSNLNPLTSFTASSRSTEFKDIFPWNIYQMITERVRISTSFVITELSKTMQWNRASRFEFDKKSMETEATTWLEFPNWGKAIVEQMPASEDRNKSKIVGLWESQSGIWVGKLTIWVRLFEREKL